MYSLYKPGTPDNRSRFFAGSIASTKSSPSGFHMAQTSTTAVLTSLDAREIPGKLLANIKQLLDDVASNILILLRWRNIISPSKNKYVGEGGVQITVFIIPPPPPPLINYFTNLALLMIMFVLTIFYEFFPVIVYIKKTVYCLLKWKHDIACQYFIVILGAMTSMTKHYFDVGSLTS